MELFFHGTVKFYRPSDPWITVWKSVTRNSCFTAYHLLHNKIIHDDSLLKAAQASTLQRLQASSKGDSVSALVLPQQDKAFLSSRLSNTEVRIMQGDSGYILKFQPNTERIWAQFSADPYLESLEIFRVKTTLLPSLLNKGLTLLFCCACVCFSQLSDS